jgi:hypothetical protein
VSSSSSADRPATRLLGRAFAVLHAEAPAHAGLLCDALARLAVHALVDGERIAPRVVAGRLAVGEPAGRADVTLRTSLPTMLALLEARRTLLDAVNRGELDVWGPAGALDAAADAFSTFLHGLVRAPSSAHLLDELRLHVAGANREIDHGQSVPRLQLHRSRADRRDRRGR